MFAVPLLSRPGSPIRPVILVLLVGLVVVIALPLGLSVHPHRNDRPSQVSIPNAPSSQVSLPTAVSVPIASPERSASHAARVPVPGKIGLLVCEPVVAPSMAPTLADFGVGCADWLHLIVAGQPELGRTPLWSARARIEHELKRADLRLTPADTPPLATMAGITHVACGMLSGTPAHCTLAYQLYTIPDRRLVGTRLTATGSWAQVAAALPTLARGMSARLGVVAAKVPVGSDLSPDDLASVGEWSRLPALTYGDQVALAKVGAHMPLAAFFLLDSQDQVVLCGAIKTLLNALPQNALVLSKIASENTEALRPYAASTAALFRRFPGNALLAHAEVWEQREWGTRSAELRAEQRLTTLSPRDPYSWLSPAATLSKMAQDLRQGRFAGDLSPGEWDSLNQVYDQWERCTVMATRLDPSDGHAWNELATAATFAGDTPRARDAFRRAEMLDPNPTEVDTWGLSMFQPKWDDDPAALTRIAIRASTRHYDDAGAVVAIGDILSGLSKATHDDRYWTMGARMILQSIAQNRTRIAKEPGNPLAHWDLALALSHLEGVEYEQEAIQEYRTAARLMPNAAQLDINLADLLEQTGQSSEQITVLRRAVALAPFSTQAHLRFGRALKLSGIFPEALAELRIAAQQDPRDAWTHYSLGDLLLRENQPAPAAVQFDKAAHLASYYTRAWGKLCIALSNSGRYEEALRAGEQAVRSEEIKGDAPEIMATVHDSMGQDNLQRKNWDASLAEAQKALESDAADPTAQEIMAEAYWGQGRTTEARAQWKNVISIGDQKTSAIAREMLAAHP